MAISINNDFIGIGLKPAHYRDILSPTDSQIGAGGALCLPDFFEIHAENFMGAGGPPHAWLSAIAEKHPLSIHGVCLSLGGIEPLDKGHLKRLRALVDRYAPALVSEHIAWSAHEGAFLNDLIAPPLTHDSLVRITERIEQTQHALGRQILVENPSQYMPTPADMPEPEFLNELARRSGCRLLLDINNIAVSAHNLGFDPRAYLNAIDASLVSEIHLAGHAIDQPSGLRIDDHGSTFSEEVGALYSEFISAAGPRPTLIEWDTDVPEFETLLSETAKARGLMQKAVTAKTATEAVHAPA